MLGSVTVGFGSKGLRRMIELVTHRSYRSYCPNAIGQMMMVFFIAAYSFFEVETLPYVGSK